ncbi:hypothetical protein SAMN05444920_107296 [Nonomuraea solani]|uniref:ATP-dependent RNA helicase A n=1 Tax=Nonomuraea solani TaxID=1144553 RepID=A0A1H6E1S4_9ACTN|nr:hypothetical protein [Nonomuraea solani]SEG91560.1 hypothetical protein SAMN05444920_107296 [Nonomuraea solani]
MKVKLIAAGGVLVTAATVIAMATPASADPVVCDLSVGDSTHSLRIDGWGVYAGRRDADACEGRHTYNRDHGDHDNGGNWDNGDRGWNGGNWGNGGWNGGGWNGGDRGWNGGGWDNSGWDNSGWGNGHDRGHQTTWAWPSRHWGSGSWSDTGWGTRGGWGERGLVGYGWPGAWAGRY